VTDESEAEAQNLFPGKEVDSLSHRHQIRLAALRRFISHNVFIN